MKIPVLIILEFHVDDAVDVPKIIEAINPPKLPYFGGYAHVVVGKDVTDVRAFITEKK